MKKKMIKMIKKMVSRMLSGDVHVWGWVTLDITNPLPPNNNLTMSAQ